MQDDFVGSKTSDGKIKIEKNEMRGDCEIS